jgi:hypothetical protein
MKSRSGFVSNSSSSSFIIAISDRSDKDKLSSELGYCETEKTDWSMVDGQFVESHTPVSSEEIVARVFSDLQDAELATDEEIMDELSSGLYWDASDSTNQEDYREGDGKINYSRYFDVIDEKCKVLSAPALKEWKELTKGKEVYILSYSDNDGESHLEHGDIFHNIPNVRVSHH